MNCNQPGSLALSKLKIHPPASSLMRGPACQVIQAVSRLYVLSDRAGDIRRNGAGKSPSPSRKLRNAKGSRHLPILMNRKKRARRFQRKLANRDGMRAPGIVEPHVLAMRCGFERLKVDSWACGYYSLWTGPTDRYYRHSSTLWSISGIASIETRRFGA
jgi:hypothetical protein